VSMSSSSPPCPTIQHIISKGAKVILSSHLVSSQPSRFSSDLMKQCSSHA
jgi:3-phosphoglycerate kinase